MQRSRALPGKKEIMIWKKIVKYHAFANLRWPLSSWLNLSEMNLPMFIFAVTYQQILKLEQIRNKLFKFH